MKEEDKGTYQFKNNLKKFFARSWYILWKDDSFKGWFFSIIFLFLFIKFIFFPLLILITGTPLPLAIVESCSMYHGVSFEEYWRNTGEWYEKNGITKENFLEFQMKNGFNKGDILLIVGANPDKIKVGDIIIFNANQKYPVIHRVVNLNPIRTKGDNWRTNPESATFENNISTDQILGKAIFRIVPYAGWIKLIFFEWMKSPASRGFCSKN
ncbi:MAG: signal peptidase I [Candidatus Pacearchaeota archaeon]